MSAIILLELVFMSNVVAQFKEDIALLLPYSIFSADQAIDTIINS